MRWGVQRDHRVSPARRLAVSSMRVSRAKSRLRPSRLGFMCAGIPSTGFRSHSTCGATDSFVSPTTAWSVHSMCDQLPSPPWWSWRLRLERRSLDAGRGVFLPVLGSDHTEQNPRGRRITEFRLAPRLRRPREAMRSCRKAGPTRGRCWRVVCCWIAGHAPPSRELRHSPTGILVFFGNVKEANPRRVRLNRTGAHVRAAAEPSNRSRPGSPRRIGAPR